MCTSSRSIMMTGLQTADNGMSENLDVPWVEDLSPAIPTIGHLLRNAGYYTAYKGKWHLTRAFDQEFPPKHLFTAEMEAYGFSDYASPGDVVGHTNGPSAPSCCKLRPTSAPSCCKLRPKRGTVRSVFVDNGRERPDIDGVQWHLPSNRFD